MEKHDDDGQQGQQQPQGSSHQAPEQSAQHAKPPEAPPAVRFASKVEEYDPEQGRSSFEPTKPAASPEPQEATPEQIQALSNTLKLQGERMKNYSFEPFSLPPSRVPSHEDSPSATPQHTHTHSPAGRQSPAMSPRPEIASPPLTPAGTSGPESSGSRSLKPGHANEGTYDTPQAITPQASGQGGSAPVSPRIPLPHRPRSEEPISRQRPASGEQDRGAGAHRRGMFSVGPSGAGSVPGSRESSPSRLSASQFYSRPFTPAGDVNDPYAANKRIPQSKNAGHIDQRFVFSRKKGRASPGSSTTSLHKTEKSEKRHSGLLGVLNKSNHDLQHTGTESTSHSRHSSMTDLRRFFKVGGSSKSIKKTASPGGSKLATSSSRASVHQVPFAEDHGLTSKYGKIGKVLGSGAGGSVKLMRRNEDNTVFAVKEFRPRHTYESEKEYVKKLTAEFCVGSALHHGNIIETLDIVQEKGKWYEVMEYAPYDLFAIVMTGKMSKQEITCCFLQILSGVTYLHSMGLAHRDLKLDNVVVSEHGIIKIIDFGSAHVFSYPFESGIVPASVYEERKYDPQAVDIWSLAIIFCCMSLRRFPWKVPRMSDNSYKLFASEPTPGHDPKKLVLPTPRTTGDAEKTPQQVSESEKEKEKVDDKQGQQEQKKSSQPEKSEKSEKPEAPVSTSAAASSSTQGTQGQKEVIRGPWRLLRLLPRESRHIIGRMLTINPRERAKMSDILEEPWVSDTVICRQIAPGQVINAEDHTHILEPPAPSK